MKKLFYGLIGVVIVILIIAYVFTKYNHSSLGITTVDLTVNCSKVTRLLVTSVVDVEVKNLSSRPHTSVTVKITAYDKNNEVVKEKFTTFDRTLEPNGSLSKPVTLPGKTRTCDCQVVSSQ